MRNAGLEEAQAGIKISGRNINNLIYADDTILMAENEEELKSAGSHHGRSHPHPHPTGSCGRGLTSKVDQNSRDPLDLLEHLPQNQNLLVLLFCAFHQLF